MRELVCLFVCLLPVLPYTLNVHIWGLYVFMKGLKADLYFIFFAMRQPDATACDVANTSQVRRKPSQNPFRNVRLLV